MVGIIGLDEVGVCHDILVLFGVRDLEDVLEMVLRTCEGGEVGWEILNRLVYRTFLISTYIMAVFLL
jgi:hypothetical protein